MTWHRRLLERTPDKTEWYCYNDDGDVRLETTWNVEPITEATKAVYNTFDRPNFKGHDWFHVASIPMAVVEDYYRKHKVNLLTDRDRLRHFVNDSDNRMFRTRPGRI